MCAGFLETSFNTAAIQHLAHKYYPTGPLKDAVRVHLCCFHATEMVVQYNEGYSKEEIFSSASIKYRLARLQLHLERNILSGKYSLNKMLEYNNSTMRNWFGETPRAFSEKVVEPEEEKQTPTVEEEEEKEDFQECPVAFGQGILSFAKELPIKLANWAGSCFTTALAGFLESLKKAFVQCFGGVFPQLERMFSWVKNIFSILGEWAISVNEKANQIFEGMEDCLYIGLALTSATCIVALLEKFLVATGMLHATCGAPMLFLTVAVAAIGVTTFVSSQVSFDVAALTTYVIQSCQLLLSRMFGTSDTKTPSAETQSDTQAIEKAEGQFSLATTLEGLASLTQGWTQKNVSEVGRSFAAITQIKNGVLSMKEIILYIFEKLGNLANNILGFDSQVMADLSLILGENLVDWLTECDAMITYMIQFKSENRLNFDRLSQLIEKGRAIRAGILLNAHRGSMQVLHTVVQALNKLLEIQNAATMAGSNATRRAPFMVFFTGKSGTGKTSVVQRLSSSWLQAEQMGSSEIYSRNGLDPFFSGYKRQAIVTYDDFGAIPGNVSNEAEIIHLVSRNAHAIVMASLEQKGMYFDSKLILASSNFIGANPESGVHDTEAYERRRHLVITVTLKEGVPYNPSIPHENQRYTLRESRAPYTPITTFETFEEMWSFVYNKYKAHDEEEAQFLASLPITESTEAKAMEALVALTTTIGNFAPKKVLDYGFKHFAGYHYLISDEDLVYFWEPQGDVRSVAIAELHLSPAEKNSLKEETLANALRYRNLTVTFAGLNPLAVHYTSQIVSKQWIGPNLQPTANCSDAYMKEQIQNLPKWQKAYLHILGKHLARDSATGWFTGLLGDVKKTLRASYMREYSSWPMPLKMAVGVTVAVIAGGGIFLTLKALWNAGTGSTFIAGAAAVFTSHSFEGQSVAPHRQASEYVFRNRKVHRRNWEGQGECYGDSYSWVADRCMGTLVWGNKTKVQVCLMPNRSFLGINHILSKIPTGSMVQFIGNSKETWISWNAAHLSIKEGTELAIYKSQSVPMITSSLVDRIVFDPEELPETFPAVMFTYKYNDLQQDYVPEIGNLQCKKVQKSFDLFYGEYSRKVASHLEYDRETIQGDCGALIIAEIKNKMCLVGSHVAGNGKKGLACFIPDDGVFHQHQGQGDFELEFQEWQVPTILGPGCAIVGVVDPKHRCLGAAKTSFIEVEESWKLQTPCDKLPSILTEKDPRLQGTENADYDPILTSMTKYAQEAGPFQGQVLANVADDIVETWYDVSQDFQFEEVSLDVAINGLEGVEYFDALVMGTSEGLPYRLDRGPGDKGKARYFEGEPGHLQISDETLLEHIEWFEKTSETRAPTIYCIESVKDERLPRRKVLLTPKSRTFSILPLSYNIVVRKKFLRFVKFLMERRDVLPCQVGVNPYSREWSSIAARLLEKGNRILCCDYSRFDGFLPKVVMELMAKMINRLCGGSERVQAQRLNLMLSACSRWAVGGKLLYQVENGIPSGFPMTVIINSIFNEILVRYAYSVCFKDNAPIRASFNQLVALVTYGDDNQISVSDAIAGQFNGEFLVQCMADLNIKITDGVDKTKEGIAFRELEHCDFLKRSFYQGRDGIWRAPMDEGSLWPQLHYVKAKKIELSAAYLANLNSVLKELYLVDMKEGTTKCKDLRSKALYCLRWIKPENVLTLRQIEAFHEHQLGQKCNFLDTERMMEDIDLIQPLVSEGMPEEQMELCKNLSVVAQHRFKGNYEDYFVVSLGINRKFKSPSDGLVINYAYGVGRGGLPTAQFLEENVFRKGCEIRKKNWKVAMENGKHILVISQNSLVVGYVFSILYLVKTGRLGVHASNVVLGRAISVCKSLNYLTKDFKYAFIQ